MPITPFQREVLALLKTSRNPESYVAGGTAIQRRENSTRYSNDIDFFHDADGAVTNAYEQDQATLLSAKYQFESLIKQPSFYRAVVTKGNESLKLEWVRDTAFRFFPVLEDEEFGYRLHDVDLAINKCLALANRTEVRDVLDVIDLDANVLSLTGCVWAACGKDPGFTPELILEMIQRHSVITPDLLAAESLAKPLDAKKLKVRIGEMITIAREQIRKLEARDLGCVYLTKKGEVIANFDQFDRNKAFPHFGSLKGSWPRFVK